MTQNQKNEGWKTPTSIVAVGGLIVSVVFNITQCQQADKSVSLEQHKIEVQKAIDEERLSQRSISQEEIRRHNQKIDEDVLKLDEEISNAYTINDRRSIYNQVPAEEIRSVVNELHKRKTDLLGSKLRDCD